jgi:CHAD domain-containing protein
MNGTKSFSLPYRNEPPVTTESLTEYFDTQYAKMTAAWSLAASRHDPEGIHDYRVCIKRLSALFSLVAFLRPGFSAKKHLRRFRRLFKSSAELRDLHIQTQIAEKMRKVPGFPFKELTVFFQSEKLTSSERFDRFAEAFDEERLLQKRKALATALEEMNGHADGRRTEGYFHALVYDIVVQVEDPERGERDLHRIRMRMKEIQYIREIIGGFETGAEGKDSFIAAVKKIHQALGKWHDLDVAQVYFDRFAVQGGVFLPEQLDPAHEWIRKEKGQLLKTFGRAWKDFRGVYRNMPAYE